MCARPTRLELLCWSLWRAPTRRERGPLAGTWRISGQSPFVEPLSFTSPGATLRGQGRAALWGCITSSLKRPSLRSLNQGCALRGACLAGGNGDGASARSGDIFGDGQMLVVRTSEGRADSLGQLVGTEQTVGLNYLALAVNPFGLYGVEPRALLGQQAGDDPHPFLLALFESPVMLPDPAPHLAAYVPAGIVPDQHQNLLADGGQLLAAPLQKARGYTAHRTAVHKAQPRLFELGDVQSVAGDGLRIGIVFFDRLLYKTQRLTSFAKAVQIRLRYSAPPALVFKTHNPIDLILRQPHQPIAPPF